MGLRCPFSWLLKWWTKLSCVCPEHLYRTPCSWFAWFSKGCLTRRVLMAGNMMQKEKVYVGSRLRWKAMQERNTMNGVGKWRALLHNRRCRGLYIVKWFVSELFISRAIFYLSDVQIMTEGLIKYFKSAEIIILRMNINADMTYETRWHCNSSILGFCNA